MINNVPLSDRSKEIILGSLLGDGSLKIHKGYKNARFSFRHSIKNKDYFFWKVSQLKEISSIQCFWLQKKGGYSQRDKLRYQSRAIVELTEMYELTHKQNKLRIRRKWLNKMTPLSLAIWWLDDGSIISNGRKGVFCTDGFEKKSVKVLAKYLQQVWNINVQIAPVGKKQNGKQNKYWRLWLRSTEELKKFLRIILPHILIDSALPKVVLMYKDDKLQQRWISEIVQKTDFSKELVLKQTDLKKKKWKRF